jgi:PIN domain nuclease of toxin-antitoxin system
MRALLDTHSFLWWIMDDPRLSRRARSFIADGRNEIFFSAASGWEIVIKAQRNRLRLPDTPEGFVAEQLTVNGFQSLPILLSHALNVYELSEHHRDPFDRLLIVQSRLEDLPLITADQDIAKYDVEMIW